MIITSKAALQNYFFSLAGNIYDNLKSTLSSNKNYDFSIDYYIDEDDDSVDINITAHDSDSLEWARECIERQRKGIL